jgi:hypothetical protein
VLLFTLKNIWDCKKEDKHCLVAASIVMSGFVIPSIASLKGAVDELRGTYYPKNETEKRVSATINTFALLTLLQVYEALSSKNWGASTTLMGEIASDSYD